MLELAVSGRGRYWGWISLLVLIIGAGTAFYWWQLKEGLAVTGLSRDVSWGFYIAQLTFLVGVAASAVMLVLPYYLHMDHFIYLYQGLNGKGILAPWMWTSVFLMFMALIFLAIPALRKETGTLTVACAMVFVGTWIDKGVGLISGGFIPSPLHEVNEYTPTLHELLISMGVYGVGVLCLTALLKIAVGVKSEAAGQVHPDATRMQSKPPDG